MLFIFIMSIFHFRKNSTIVSTIVLFCQISKTFMKNDKSLKVYINLVLNFQSSYLMLLNNFEC